MSTALRSSYRNAPLSEVTSRRPARFRRVAASGTNDSNPSASDSDSNSFSVLFHWFRDEKEKILSLVCIVSLILSVGLFAASFSNTNTLIVSSAGDGQNIAYAALGYNELCFVPQILGPDNSTIILLSQECTVDGIDSSCNFQFSSFAQGFQSDHYGQIDSHLSNCTEFRTAHAFHVLGIVFAVVSLVLMILSHLNLVWFKNRRCSHPLKVSALLTSFASGSFGVMAQCILIDWMNFNQKDLVSLAYSTFISGSATTLSTVVLGQTAFYEVGGWVCSLAASILYIAHFPNALAK